MCEYSKLLTNDKSIWIYNGIKGECMVEKKMVRDLMDKLAFKNTIAPSITLTPFEC